MTRNVDNSLSHSDLYSITGKTPTQVNIAGHEGIGHIVKGRSQRGLHIYPTSKWLYTVNVTDLTVVAGSNVSQDLIGKRVGIKWLYKYCDDCEICSKDVTYCPNQKNPGRNVLGTFQQYICSMVKPLTFIPDGISSELAAPLLCAGITIYSAILKLRLNPGEWLLLPGTGGGLGHLGVQIAHALGFKVIAVDSGESKRKLCLELGATRFLDFKVDDVDKTVKELTNGYGVHGAVCLAGNKAGYAQAISQLRNTGVLVCVGLAMEELPISPFMMIVRGISVFGSSVGTEQEMKSLLEMASKGKIKAIVDVFDFQELDEVLEKLRINGISGRTVVKLPI
ncbi:hypothetical protein VE00_09908 [Pseudogymnoascus sp. WSF 3629]|nr:hypothetical protein VE00_09908 [Pseudogymnoascus sp. WSF 3629]